MNIKIGRNKLKDIFRAKKNVSIAIPKDNIKAALKDCSTYNSGVPLKPALYIFLFKSGKFDAIIL
ncbi:MAG: hypothetical protein QXK76_00500 [Candidatus Woesearchaeota archaeon]